MRLFRSSKTVVSASSFARWSACKMKHGQELLFLLQLSVVSSLINSLQLCQRRTRAEFLI